MIKNILKPFKYILSLCGKGLDKSWKAIKYFWLWLVDAFIETLNQLWTLLGMFAAWLVLEGSAKAVVGYAILITLFVWLITIRIRD